MHRTVQCLICVLNVSRHTHTDRKSGWFFIFVSWFFFSIVCIAEPWPLLSYMHTHRRNILFLLLKNEFHQSLHGRANTCHITMVACLKLVTVMVSFPAQQREEMEIPVSTSIAAANMWERYFDFIHSDFEFVLFAWELPLMPFYSFSSQYLDFVCTGLC